MIIYPLVTIPFFRHGPATPWGGSALHELYGKAIPDDRTGESLEISALTGMESVILNGEMAGCALSRAVATWGAALTGLGDGSFPLLVKLLHARAILSVQVHPDDAYAAARDGKRGKTEAWLILAAEPGSRVVYGIKTNADDFAALAGRGEVERALRWIPVYPGDVLYMPHGCVHALGGGIVAYEIQQASDATYRIWDWGRLDEDGLPRSLRIEDAKAAMRPELRLDKAPGATAACPGGSQTIYIADSNFELRRLNVWGTMPLRGGRMLLLTALGDVTLRWPGGEENLAPGQSCVIPAALDGVSLNGRATVACASLPDRDAVRAELGDGAKMVVGLR